MHVVLFHRTCRLSISCAALSSSALSSSASSWTILSAYESAPSSVLSSSANALKAAVPFCDGDGGRIHG